jgi:hypothetical protein
MSLNIQPKSFITDGFDFSFPGKTSPVAGRPTFADGAIDSVKTAVAGDGSVVPTPVESKGTSGGGFFSRVFEGVKNIGDLFSVDTLKSLGGGIKGLFGKVMDAGMWAGGKLGDGFMKFMEGGTWVAGKMREGVIAGAKAVGGFFEKVGEGFKNFFQNPLDHLKGFGSGIKALGTKFFDGMLWAGGKLGDGFMKFMEGGAWVAGKAREGVVAAGEAVVSAAKKVGSFIKGLF